MNERAIFDKASEIQDLGQRRAYLDQACPGQPELRARVENLLNSHESVGSFLDLPAPDQLQPGASDPPNRTQEYTPDADNGEQDDSLQITLSFLQPSTKPGSIGTLGHYEILQVLGQGAFGIVFKAFDEKLHRLVAIKAMNPQLAATSPPRKRFLREARSVAAIKHENIVQVYSVEEQPLPYLVMEYIDGQTLQQKLDGAGPLEVPEILHLGRQMAAGLAAAHEKSLIHRDIKPGNILLEAGAEQKVKITDFGLARAADDATMTRTGTISGTPMYMAPEQAMGQDLDHRADLFSLGSVLYQMTCGRAPFRGPNAIAVLKRVVDEMPRPIRQILPEAPDWLCAIIEKLHAKNPDERYQSAKEVADQLGLCQSKLQAGVSPTAVSLGLRPALVESIVPVEKAEPKPNKFPVAGVAAGIVLMVSVMAAGVFFLNKNKNDGNVAVVPSAKTTTPATMTPAESERDLAEWLIKQPGVESITVFTNGSIVIKPGDSLPDAPFFVNVIDWRNAAEITDNDLARIGTAQRLNRLNLASKEGTHFVLEQSGTFSNITDQGLEKLFSRSVGLSLTRVTIRGDLPKVTDQGYLVLNRANKLEELFFLNSRRGWGVCLSDLNLPNLIGFHVQGQEIPGGLVQMLSSRSPDLTSLALIGYRWAAADRDALSKLDLLSVLNLNNCNLRNDTLANVGKLSRLTVLILNGSPEISDEGIAHLAGLTELRQLELIDSAITEEACQTLASFTKLEQLSLSRTGIKDSGLASLTALKSLRVLGLIGCKRLSDTGLESLAKMSNLAELDIHTNPRLTEAAVRKLQAALPKCKIISDFPNITQPTPAMTPAQSERELAEWLIKQPGVGLILLVREDGSLLPEVKAGDKLPDGAFFVTLLHWLEADAITDADLARIGQAQRLGVLSLGSIAGKLPNVTDKGLDRLFSPAVSKSLGQLQIAEARLPNVTDDGYLVLNRARNLILVVLYPLQAGTGAFLSQLDLPKLGEFRVLGEGIPGGWLVPFSKRSPDLPFIMVKGSRLTRADVQALTGMDLIRGLDLSNCGLDDEALTPLSKMSKVNELALNESPEITDAGAAKLASLKELKSISLGDCSIGDETCKTLATLDKLEYAFLAHTRVSDRGVEALALLKALKHLVLSNTRLTDKGVESLAPFNSLETLQLSQCKRLTDQGLESLGKIGSLTYLEIQTNPQLTEAAVRKLQAALPKCKITSDFPNITGAMLAPAIDSDRRAAEYVLSIGGSVHIRENGKEIMAASELPMEAFELTNVSLGHNAKVSDVGLANLKDCNHLKQLNLAATPVTDAGLAHFRNCKSLIFLALNSTQISDAGLGYFTDNKNLTKLGLSNTKVSDAGLAHFQGCNNLTDLDLTNCTQVGDAGLSHFKGCQNLAILMLNATQVTDAGLAIFKDRENLTHLLLKGCVDVTDSGLSNFRDCKRLRILSVGLNPQITDAGMANFRGCDELTVLDVDGTKVTDVGLANFRDCKKVTYLDFSYTQVTDAGLANFKDCSALESLALGNTKISDTGLADLVGFENLDQLALEGTQVSDTGLTHIKHCQHLTVLNLDLTRVSDAGLADLASLPKLSVLIIPRTRISLRGYEQLKTALPKCQINWSESNRTVAEQVLAVGGTISIGVPGQPESRPVQSVADLPDHFFQVRRVSLAGVARPKNDAVFIGLQVLCFPKFDGLESLDLSGLPGTYPGNWLTSNHGLQELILIKAGVNPATLPKLPALKRLVLDDNVIDGPGLAAFSQQSTVVELSLARTGLTDALLADLPNLPALKRLVLDGNEIRGNGIGALKSQPELIELSLGCPTYSDLFAKNLTELKQIKRLSLAGSGLTDAGIKQLSGLTNLETLDLRRTKATAAVIDELKAALLKCQIQWDGMQDK